MNSGVFVGIDIGGTNTKLAAVNRRGRVVARDVIDTRPDEGPNELFRRIGGLVPAMVGRRRTLAGAGIGCAGLIDPRRGRLHSSPNLPGWLNSPIARIARRSLGVYTFIDNDANAAAYGEYRRGCARGSRMFVCITLGTGVGGGLVSGGQVLRGARNYAGEIGHMTVSRGGPSCKCGNRGCLEAHIGTDALVRQARRHMRKNKGGYLSRWVNEKKGPITPKTIADAARRGDSAAIAVFDDAASHLGTAIASLVNILNPDTVALVGGVAGGFDLMKRRLREVVAARAFAESAEVARIARGRLGNDAAPIGVALLAAEAAAGGR